MAEIYFLANNELLLSGATQNIMMVAETPPAGLWSTMTQYFPFEEYLEDQGDWYIPDYAGNKSSYEYGAYPVPAKYNNGLFNNYFANRILYPSASYNTFSGSFTVSAWVNFIDCSGYGTDEVRYIVHKVTSDTYTTGYLVGANTTGGVTMQFIFAVSLDGTLQTITTTKVGGYAIDTWYHVVAVYNSSSGMKLYVDNELVASNSTTGALLDTSGGSLNMSNDYNTNNHSMYGTLDEVALFSSALSTTLISELYNDGTGTFYTG